MAKGKNYITGMPESFEISSTETTEAFDGLLEYMYEAIRSVLEVTPPELIGDISGQGIVLTGGGALLYGLDRYLQERIGIEVKVADDAVNCVVKGTGIALKNIDRLLESGYIFKNREEITGLAD